MKFHTIFFGRSLGVQAKAQSDGVISLADALTTLTLALCAMIALVFPRALWLWASGQCASIHMAVKKPNLTATAETLNDQGMEVSDIELAHDLLSGNYLENIETVSEYLGYRGERNVVVEGVANVTRALESGRGVILWHSPFRGAALLEKRAYGCGGLSVTHLRSYTHPYSSTAFGLRILNPVKTRVENQYLENVVMLVPGGGRAALQQLTQALQDNQVVSVTAIGSGKNAIEVPFLGGNLRLARGVPSLAYATGAIVIPTATSILSGPKYVIEFEVPLEVDNGLSEPEFQKALVEAYADRMAPRVRSHPGSWRGWILSHTWGRNIT